MKRLIRKAMPVVPEGVWVQREIAKTLKQFGLDPYTPIRRFVDLSKAKEVYQKSINRAKELGAPTKFVEEREEKLRNLLAKRYIEEPLHEILDMLLGHSIYTDGFQLQFDSNYNFDEGQLYEIMHKLGIDPNRQDHIKRFILQWCENMRIEDEKHNRFLERIEESDGSEPFFDFSEEPEEIEILDKNEVEKWKYHVN